MLEAIYLFFQGTSTAAPQAALSKPVGLSTLPGLAAASTAWCLPGGLSTLPGPAVLLLLTGDDQLTRLVHD